MRLFLLGVDARWPGSLILMFRGALTFIVMKMEVEQPCETLASISQTVLHGIKFQHIMLILSSLRILGPWVRPVTFENKLITDTSSGIEIGSILL
jgi:hypothetical protein